MPAGAAGRSPTNRCLPMTATAAPLWSARHWMPCATRRPPAGSAGTTRWAGRPRRQGSCWPFPLSRNFAYQILLQEELTRHGVQLVLVQEPDASTPQQVLLRQILSVISEYERTQIAERSRRGRIHRARQGSLNMLTKSPYGYRLIRKTETLGARLEIDDADYQAANGRAGPADLHPVRARWPDDDAGGGTIAHDGQASASCRALGEFDGGRHPGQRGLCRQSRLPQDHVCRETGAPQPRGTRQGRCGTIAGRTHGPSA